MLCPGLMAQKFRWCGPCVPGFTNGVRLTATAYGERLEPLGIGTSDMIIDKYFLSSKPNRTTPSTTKRQ